jgi:hypothetical protein
MRTLTVATVLVLLSLGMGSASAQVVSAEVTIAAPTIQFEVAPPLVFVGPGVQVVEGYDEEIFFTGGWYWCRRGDVWFRTHDYHGGWIVAPRRYVPARIMRVPPGHYRNYYPNPGRPVYRGGGGGAYHPVRRQETVARPYYGGGPAYRQVRGQEVRPSRGYAGGGERAVVARQPVGGGPRMERGGGGDHRRH